MLFALLLTFGLLVACGKDDPDLIGDYPYYNNSPSVTSYEAEWVMDRQVIGKTVMNIIGSQIEIEHMPNEVLLKNVSEIQGLHLVSSSWFILYEFRAYNDKSLYVDSFSKSFTLSEGFRSGNYYLVKASRNDDAVVPDFEYIVGLEYQLDGTYEQNTDQWTLKWTVSRVNLHESNSPSSVMFGYTFDPELTLMLISTKRLN
jgi:hypothetical protein